MNTTSLADLLSWLSGFTPHSSIVFSYTALWTSFTFYQNVRGCSFSQSTNQRLFSSLGVVEWIPNPVTAACLQGACSPVINSFQVRASPETQTVKCLPAMQETWVGKIPRRREWLPTQVFLPGEFHGQRSLAGYSPWDHRELDWCLTRQVR